LSVCPEYLDYDVAVLRCCLAACYINVKAWNEVIQEATAALEALNMIPYDLMWEDRKRAIRRIRMTALLQRGTALSELGGSENLTNAQSGEILYLWLRA
jgi:hypothetical protein